MLRIKISLILILLAYANCMAQFKNGKELLLSPVKWKTNDWLAASAVIAGTSLLLAADEPVRKFAVDNNGYVNSLPFTIGKWTGEPLTTGAILGGFLAYGYGANDKGALNISRDIAESFLYTGAITFIIKAALGRHRPYNGEGAMKLTPFSFMNNDHQSFPSGHSSAAFSLCTVLAKHTEEKWLKALFYMPAVLTTASRVYHDQHWSSDVFFGACLGYFVADFIVERNKGKDNKVLLAPSNNMISFTLSF